MKKYCLVLFATLLFSYAEAQQVTVPSATATASPPITAASTAAECVQFINKKLRTAIGSINPSGHAASTLTDAQFTGGKYVYQVEFSTTKRQDNYHTVFQTHVSDINWAAYQSATATKSDYNKAFTIKVAFTKTQPVIYQSKFYNFLTGAMDGGYPASKSDTLSLFVSQAEQASVNDLDKAFKRLSQLAKENPSLFKTEVFKPKEIEGKASFNETLDYIYNNHPKELSYYGTSYDQYGNYEGAVEVKYTGIKITQLHNTDSLLIEWTYNYRVPKYLAFEERRIAKRFAIQFSMKDVEQVKPFHYTFLNGFVTLEKAREATFPCGIGLFAKQGKKLFRVFEYNYSEAKVSVQMQADIGIPTSYYSNKDNVETVRDNIKNGQLFKAFNHLRNLCGAPDPLKFD
nr:hypothetical protein [uncultured Lacibacter sp.]